MKKILFILLILFLCIFILQGCALYETERTVNVMDEGETVLSKTYKIGMEYAIRAKLFHKGSFMPLYEKMVEKNPEEPLSKLNIELSRDIIALPKNLNKEPINAKVEYKGNGKFVYFKEMYGIRIDKEKLIKDVFASLSGDGNIYISKEYIVPETRQSELIAATRKIASFTTNYKDSSAERKHNISLASQKIESSIIDKNCYFSFNSTVGPRSVERGFRTAKIIVDGEFVLGVGGGVCQVSTTLYNVWCLAGLKVSQSSTHSLPISYIKPGLDAMVNSSTDLVLYNDSLYPVYIDSAFDGEKLTFTLYGKPCGCIVKLRSEVLQIIPCEDYTIDNRQINDWQEGETFRIIKKPKSGLVGASYRDYYDEKGALVYSERLRKTVYRPQKGKIVYRELV